VKTINPIPEKDAQSAPETVIDELTRVLARMLVEERLKKEFRRLRPDTRSKHNLTKSRRE
jgi:hypothetical protein